MPPEKVDQEWPCADRRAALKFADALIASNDADDRGRGYALRSVLRFDGSDFCVGLTWAMLVNGWIVTLPVGVVYDACRLPVQGWNRLQVSREDMELASRDIDEARRLGITGRVLDLFGSSYVPIDSTSYYVAAAAAH